jgi:acyl-CoA reductase-like NAD-dependent aldehyde dehydrogenase
MPKQSDCSRAGVQPVNDSVGHFVVLRWHGVLQVVALANDNPYGLASGVLAKDQATIDGLVRRIKAGTVWVNTYNIYDAGKSCFAKALAL